MIEDIKARWVICTPTKTGTTSTTALLCQKMSACAYKILPVHRPDCEETITDRLMTAREPLDRFMSMYKFLQRDRSRMHQYALEGFVPFVREFYKRWDEADWATWHLHIDTYMWLAPQRRFLEHFKPTSIHFVVEDGGKSILDHLSKTYGYEFPPMPHLRKAKDRGEKAPTESEHEDLRQLKREEFSLYQRLMDDVIVDQQELEKWRDGRPWPNHS